MLTSSRHHHRRTCKQTPNILAHTIPRPLTRLECASHACALSPRPKPCFGRRRAVGASGGRAGGSWLPSRAWQATAPKLRCESTPLPRALAGKAGGSGPSPPSWSAQAMLALSPQGRSHASARPRGPADNDHRSSPQHPRDAPRRGRQRHRRGRCIGQCHVLSVQPLGRQTAAKHMLDNTSTWGYDSVGSLIVSTDAADKTTYFQYDALGRRTAQVDAMAGVTYWHYDAAGNTVVLLDAGAGCTCSGPPKRGPKPRTKPATTRRLSKGHN